MGREQRRKEQFKKKNNKAKTETLDTSVNWTTIIKLVCFIVISLFVLYYILAVFVTKEIDISNGNSNEQSTTKTDTTQNTNTVSNKILASNIFEQKEEEYYVYFYDFNDEDETVANSISQIKDIPVYRVDTSNSLNANYVIEGTGNKEITNDIDDLKVSNPTLIKIEADQVVDYFEGGRKIYVGLGLNK